MTRLQEILGERVDSLDWLAREARIAEDRLLQIAAGAEPTLGELRGIASALGLELAEFAEPTETEARASLLFRRTAGVAAIAEPDARTIVGRLSRSLEILSSHEPNIQWTEALGELREPSSATQQATIVRGRIYSGDFVSPFLRLPQVLSERLGIIVCVVNSKEIDGASAIVALRPFVFVARRFSPRMLFTLAHELGHLLAHHDLQDGFLSVERVSEGESDVPRERFANEFASALLLPEEGVAIALRRIRSHLGTSTASPLGDAEILLLSRVYGVSFFVAARRCEEFGLLPSGGALSLHQYLVRTHGSPEKRAQLLDLPPRPDVVFPSVPTELLDRAVDRVRRGDLSIGRASQLLGMSIPEVMWTNRES